MLLICLKRHKIPYALRFDFKAIKTEAEYDIKLEAADGTGIDLPQTDSVLRY